MPSLTFSAVVCTHNRWMCLADALRTLQDQRYPTPAYEIIVVDNASTDDTQAVVQDLSDAGGRAVRYLNEPRLGLSRARNAGARAARYEVIAYTDDDALADPGWLEGLAAAYQVAGDNVVAVGGRVELLWEASRPAWFPPALEPYLSGTEHLGRARRLLRSHEYPVGANFTVRREALLQVGGFNEALARYNDERDLSWRLRRVGGMILYEPDAVVRHRISDARTRRGSLLARAYWQGVSDVLMEQGQQSGAVGPRLVSSAFLLVQALRDGAHAGWAFAAARRMVAFERLFWAAGRLGRARAQLLRRSHAVPVIPTDPSAIHSVDKRFNGS